MFENEVIVEITSFIIGLLIVIGSLSLLVFLIMLMIRIEDKTRIPVPFQIGLVLLVIAILMLSEEVGDRIVAHFNLLK